ILLARLYGVTLDELLRTDSVPMPDSEGISLRKEDYIYGGTQEDDGEIYPNGRPNINSAAANQTADTQSADRGEDAAKNSSDPADFIRSVADFTVNVTKEALNTTAQALSKANKDIENGKGIDEAVGKSFESSFKDFGKKVESADGLNFRAEDKDFAQTASEIRDEAVKMHENHKNVQCDKPHKHGAKYPATLLDKLFPLAIGCLFFFTVSIHLQRIGWLVFFAIPLYYIASHQFKRYKHGDCTAPQAFWSFIDGALPVGVTLFFLAFGMLFGGWYIIWTIFFIIPLYYTAKEAIKKKNLMIFCYPVAVVWVYLLVVLVFHDPIFALPLFVTVPVYYIVLDHFRRNKK
ncbi:MAG: hypothetical protein ACI4JF_00500, partial [Oscillospiraceae bacterium]